MPDGTIRERVRAAREKLAPLKAELDQRDTELAKLVEYAEDGLKKLNLGVPISVVYDRDDDAYWSSSLVYRKWGGSWRLVSEFEAINGEDKTTPLTELSRGERAEAIEMLPDLLEAAADLITKQIAARDEVITTVRETVSELGVSVPDLSPRDLEGKASSGIDPSILTKPGPGLMATATPSKGSSLRHGVTVTEVPTRNLPKAQPSDPRTKVGGK